MLETRLVTSRDGHKLRVARVGNQAGTDLPTPLVLLHGYPETLQIFCRLARLLRRHAEVIAFDWPGMGASEPWPGGVSPVHMARRLIRVLDELKLSRAHVAAMDMGGQPALVAAAEYPGRIEKLVVMNSLVLWDEPTSWEIRLLRRHGWNRFFIESFPRVVFRRAERTFLDRADRLPRELRGDFWEHFRRGEVRRFISRMCGGYQGFLPRLPHYYEKVRRPTLVLWGERDHHFPRSHGERLAELVPQAALELIGEAGHWMVWSHAERVASAIERFLWTDSISKPSDRLETGRRM